MNEQRDVPMSEWIPHPVFDSAEYLKRSAVGEHELPGYDPNAPVDPDHLGDDEFDETEAGGSADSSG